MATLETLPARVAAVELQIVQLRDEMREGFSAIHQELHGMNDRFQGMDDRFRGMEERFLRMDEQFLGVDERFRGLEEALRQEIRAGDEETRRYMRVLHEEVISRIAAIQEGRR